MCILNNPGCANSHCDPVSTILWIMSSTRFTAHAFRCCWWLSPITLPSARSSLQFTILLQRGQFNCGFPFDCILHTSPTPAHLLRSTSPTVFLEPTFTRCFGSRAPRLTPHRFARQPGRHSPPNVRGQDLTHHTDLDVLVGVHDALPNLPPRQARVRISRTSVAAVLYA
jgi:hypothetical protein